MGSPQASTWNRHRPSASGVTSAAYRSRPGSISRILASGCRWPSGPRSTTPAPGSSCPSRNTVALTSKVSPATALAGRRPQSITGSTSLITIRPITPERYPARRRCTHAAPAHYLRIGSLRVRAIRTFTIRASLPEPLAPLHDLMLNLRWSWHAGTRELCSALDPAGGERAGHDPIALLGEVPPEHLAALAASGEYLDRLHRAAADLGEYLSAARWYQRSGGGRRAGVGAERGGGDEPARGRDKQSGGGREARGRERQSGVVADGAPPAAIAYFSPEFGLAAALPQYSGGLGILAGDHLKAASDLGVPLIGVGLLYRHGYFSQSLSPEAWQLERYPAGDPNGLPLTLLRGTDGSPVTVELILGEGGPLAAQVWLAQVGRVPLLLLDSYIEQNDPGLREVTDRLYGGGSEHRLRQELLLGMGGVRAVRAYCELTGHPQPEVFHTNEGHAGFLGLERIREYAAQGLSFDEAIELCRAGTVFTTHTPVPAGIDRFARDLMERQFGGDAADPALPRDRVLALGAETYPGGDPAVFNMAVMGMRLAQRVNGVSRLHGQVSREMFAGLWP